MPTVAALVAVVLSVGALAVPAPAVADAAPRERVIVQVRDADPATAAADLAGRHRGRVTHVYRHAVSAFAVELPAPAVAALAVDPRVVTVEPDVPVRLLGEVPTGVARTAITSNAVADIDGEDRRVDVDIAVLDTGIDATHPDLNVAGGVDCGTGTCVRVPTPVDLNWHGTHVAGTTAAIDDGRGVVGAAPGARLWSVRVLDADGTAELSAIMAGLDWVVANAGTIEVANASLGCACQSATLDAAVAAVADAGVVLVTAAGNEGTSIDGHAMTAHPDAVTVSAMADLDGAPGAATSGSCDQEADDTFASFSSFGEAVDLAAPGVCIASTVPVSHGSYGRSSGSSMAAPHVAGAAALYIAEHGVGRSASRPATVRRGLIGDWSVPQSSACGFAGGVTGEPLLYLTACEAEAGTADPETSPGTSIGRLAGSDRIATAVEVSRAVFAAGAPAAVVAYAGDFPDALAATPLAAALTGPVLLNARDRLHPAVAAELDRLGVSTVHVMGGSAAQTEDVEEALRDRGLRPVRVAGDDRFATAARAAAAAVEVWQAAGVEVSSSAVLALGTDFPDALSGGALAASRRAPLVLTRGGDLPAATSAVLRDLGTSSVTVMGGTAAISPTVVEQLEGDGHRVGRLAGQDRFETAVAAADASVQAGATYRSVLLASGRSFPDALAGAPAVASRGGVLLLSERDDLPDASSEALRTASDVRWVRLAGGRQVLTDAVHAEAAAAAGIEP